MYHWAQSIRTRPWTTGTVCHSCVGIVKIVRIFLATLLGLESVSCRRLQGLCKMQQVGFTARGGSNKLYVICLAALSTLDWNDKVCQRLGLFLVEMTRHDSVIWHCMLSRNGVFRCFHVVFFRYAETTLMSKCWVWINKSWKLLTQKPSPQRTVNTRTLAQETWKFNAKSPMKLWQTVRLASEEAFDAGILHWTLHWILSL